MTIDINQLKISLSELYWRAITCIEDISKQRYDRIDDCKNTMRAILSDEWVLDAINRGIAYRATFPKSYAYYLDDALDFIDNDRYSKRTTDEIRANLQQELGAILIALHLQGELMVEVSKCGPSMDRALIPWLSPIDYLLASVPKPE